MNLRFESKWKFSFRFLFKFFTLVNDENVVWAWKWLNQAVKRLDIIIRARKTSIDHVRIFKLFDRFLGFIWVKDVFLNRR